MSEFVYMSSLVLFPINCPISYADWDLAAKEGLDVFLRRELIGWSDDQVKLAQSAKDGTAVSRDGGGGGVRLFVFFLLCMSCLYCAVIVVGREENDALFFFAINATSQPPTSKPTWYTREQTRVLNWLLGTHHYPSLTAPAHDDLQIEQLFA